MEVIRNNWSLFFGREGGQLSYFQDKSTSYWVYLYPYTHMIYVIYFSKQRIWFKNGSEIWLIFSGHFVNML